MCGIAGLINFDPTLAAGIIKKMVFAQEHRGPDATGLWQDDGAALGHNRLAIIDLDEKAGQPMHSSDGRYVMVYNGEIYNYQNLKKELKGVEWKTSSDSEVLLEAYIRWGGSYLHKLNGMFAFAIWDKQDKRLFVARDRLGKKPFYYAINKGRFLFSSELRTLLKTDVLPSKINLQSVHDFLRFQWVQSPDTIIEGISSLPPGYYGIWQNGRFTTHSWWDIHRFEAVEGISESNLSGSVQKEIKRLFYTAVEQRLVSDVPIGAFLSGGIDSGLIVATMANLSKEKVNTFTLGFKEKQYDESGFAEIIAKKYDTNHQTLVCSVESIKNEIPEILDTFDTPSADGINSFVISRLVKKTGITVALSGLGGDELFCGYPVFRQLPALQRYTAFWRLPHSVRNLISKNIPNSGARWEKIARLINSRDGSKESLYPFFREINGKRKASSYLIPEFQNSKFEEYLSAERKSSILSWLSVSEITGYTQNVLLKDTDMCCMANSLEVRVPFFDYRLVEYVIGLADNIKQPLSPKKLLIDAMKDELPFNNINRPKMGFAFPWDVWIRNDLKLFVADILSKSSNYEFLHNKEIEITWQRYLSGDNSVKWYQIWNLVCLIHWLDKNLE